MLEVAQTMLREGFDVALVARVTKLSIEQVTALTNQ
jgi:predicted transposase YdaD